VVTKLSSFVTLSLLVKPAFSHAFYDLIVTKAQLPATIATGRTDARIRWQQKKQRGVR
jgi:hypothetical protein